MIEEIHSKSIRQNEQHYCWNKQKKGKKKKRNGAIKEREKEVFAHLTNNNTYHHHNRHDRFFRCFLYDCKTQKRCSFFCNNRQHTTAGDFNVDDFKTKQQQHKNRNREEEIFSFFNHLHHLDQQHHNHHHHQRSPLIQHTLEQALVRVIKIILIVISLYILNFRGRNICY